MSGNTGLLRAMCDPYGAESRVQLMGGIFPESYRGRHMWHCDQPADAGRFRTQCERGHRSSTVMPLCVSHRRELQRRQMGMCTRCAWPVEAVQINQLIEKTVREMDAAQRARDRRELESLSQRYGNLTYAMQEMWESGRISRVPLVLVEVS